MNQRPGRALAAAACAGIALFFVGCQDDLASPTKGFLEVDTGSLSNVEVFVDGVSQGVDPGRIGPLPAGSYLVSVSRTGFTSSPDGEVAVEVLPAQTARARFTLTAVEFGSIAVSATDELTGVEVIGAEILRDEGSGFVATGLVTPAVIQQVQLGPSSVLVRSADHADAVESVSVSAGQTVDAAIELGPRRAVLAEMFTYVTCPNCPESADSLQSLVASRPGRVHVIEWHTLSPLPLYDPRWVEREAAYGGGVAWPSVILQGGYADTPALLVGSENATLVQYRARADAYLAECESGCDYALVAETADVPGAVDVVAHVKWRGGPARGSLVLRFVLVEGEVVLGPRLFHDVPRSYAERAVSFASPGEILEIGASLPVESAWGELHAVVYLQSDATLEILAVGGTH